MTLFKTINVFMYLYTSIIHEYVCHFICCTLVLSVVYLKTFFWGGGGV